MPITDDQEATLRAMLAGQAEEYQRRLDALGPEAGRGYNALVSAAFTLAVDKRFPEGTPAAQVIEYVGEVRSRGESAARLDPRVAEGVILAVTSGGTTEGIEPREGYQARLVILAALAADARMDDAALSTFTGEARKLADNWLA